ncbi:GDP-mannose 4,6-dehydratase [Candidatus Sumerlaeota bacterium]|nr:GDP-mannose 4,6-dehydratase [Candidatus Sumerlaeota bacterium]
MKYLITGGAGFIGSHLAEELLQDGCQVSVLDDLSTGSIRNIQQLKADSNFSYTIGSIMDLPLLAELIDDADAVFHLAAAVGVRRIVDDPVQTIVTNIRGTENVLEQADKKKKKVLLASTSEVYGKSAQLPFHEDGDIVIGPTCRPRWSYACSKAIDEFLALAYDKSRDLPTVIVRLFNTVGPRQTGRYGMVIPRFVRQALADEELTVYGDGEQTRCFAHVSDIVEALRKLMQHPQGRGKVINIGSQEEVTINQLAERVIARTGSQSVIKRIPFDVAYSADFEDMERRKPCLEAARQIIDYAPRRNLDVIIDDMAAYCRENPE